MFQHFFFILRKLQSLQNSLITFHQLCCCKPGWNSGSDRMIFNQMNNAMETSVYRTAIVILAAKVLTFRFFLISRHMKGMTNQFLRTFIPKCRNRNNRYANLL